MKQRIITASILAGVVFFVLHSVTFAEDIEPPIGLPCADGSDGFRDKMPGARMNARIDRIDGNGEGIRYSPSFDAIFLAQCMDPASSNATQTLFQALQADQAAGVITKCKPDDKILLDSKGRIQFCDEEASEFFLSDGSQWLLETEYDDEPGEPPCTEDCGPTDPGGGVIPPPEPGSEADAVAGYAGSVVYSPDSGLYLVTALDLGTHHITMRMMDRKNKPKSNQISLENNPDDYLSLGYPRAAYSPDAKKFIVLWTESITLSQTRIYAQFVDPVGRLIGGNFVVYDDSVMFYSNGNSLKYDSRNKKFILAGDKLGGGSQRLALIQIELNGASKTTFFTSSGNIGGPDVAINTLKNEYCLGYQLFGSSLTPRPDLPPPTGAQLSWVAVLPVNAATMAQGQEGVISLSTSGFGGIAYDSLDDQYGLTWGAPSGTMMTTISSCNDKDPKIVEQDVTQRDGGSSSTIIYNPASNTFALTGQSGPTGTNFYLIVDAASSETVSSGLLFRPDLGHFNPAIAANTDDGTFAMTSSEERKMTKFVANLGWGSVSLVRGTKAFGAAPEHTTPSEGLPTDLGQFIGAIFLWSLRIIGLIIFMRFFWAGIKWFTARGNTAPISEAKEIMKNAALGAVILFAAYLILYSLNPDFVGGSLNLPGISGPEATTTVPGTCNNSVCSNGIVGPCQYDTQCGAPVACNNSVCNNGIVGPCQSVVNCVAPPTN